jgi:hypothetical protein
VSVPEGQDANSGSPQVRNEGSLVLDVDPRHGGNRRLRRLTRKLGTLLDIEPIYSADVVDYAFKALKNGNASPDDIQIYR